MALIATDQSCKPNGTSVIYHRVGARKDVIQAPLDGFKTNKMQPKETDYSTDGLPKAFLHSLRTLFDILDDSGRGYVHISEIESRWQGADTRELPGGVLGCLRRVTPPHGCLTFERFVAGLRYSMLNPENSAHFKAQAAVQPLPQKPAPLGPRVEGKVRPLGPSNVTNTQQLHRGSSLQSRARPEEGSGYPACGQVRYGAGFQRSGRSLERVTVSPEDGAYRTDPVHPGTTAAQPQQGQIRAIESLALESPQLHHDPCVVKSGLPRSQSESATGFNGGSRRHGRSREEQRRHTISNGVDYEMLKQMKELEQEKDSLLAGLEVVERARDWYQGQIHNVTEKQRQVGQSSHCTDFFTEASQSRMNVLIPKLQDVNRSLNDLISCPGMPSFPSDGAHTAVLSTNSQPPAPAPPQAIQRLKDQNRLLTQEVTEKSERIAQLEQEKSALIKQLFEARSRSAQDTSTLDSTFI
ncbi:suppressor APC domain-containing protein 2 [Kryptolebias marmoratus]|uniref:suppressor APC domain-containing protein 2 n=1 Tax=Kryptolebias marmoratus TaxID=37003 RepID=UPI0007F92E67|nr:suppressor APC domain-containing protein 2 [Kryptolebias marmoratus]